MGALPEVEHAMEVTRKQSEVSYRRGREELRLYSSGADRPDILHAANATKLASDVSYKSVPQPVHPDVSLLDRTDIQHLKEASKLASQVKYKESFDRDLKGQRPKYNPLDCLSFRHSQAAAALASQVKYRTNQKAEGSSDLPNLLQLEHALHASKLQSNVEYKKKHKEEKARFHAAAETAEQLHHKENAVLHSQVRYREEYERSRGRCQMEFGDTAAYKVSKEAQRNQSEREYREGLRGAACRASSLLSEKAYRKDLEQEVKGRGLSGVGLEETPELLRVKRASEIQSQRSYRQTEQLRESCYGTVTDTPELLHASYLKDVYSQKKYRDEAERLKGRRSLIAETAETQRVRANQRHVSPLHYSWDSKLMRGLMSSVTETPELVLARENAKRISDVCYREEVGRGTAVANTPEMERVRRNQDNVSSVKYKQSSVKASSVAVTPELERVRQNQDNISSVKYRRGLQEMKGLSCSEPDTPEYRRARRSQDCVSMVAARRGSCAPPQAKYHEDFERARGRGGTPGLDEPGMERYQRANQMMGEAGYGRGPHPQAMETDRRPGGIIVDLKVWRTDPGSIFDFDPLEDDIQSKSLRRMSERIERRPLSQQSVSSLTSDLWDRSSADTPGTSLLAWPPLPLPPLPPL
uniref:nebulette-like n=1 Tax=Gasterosteus aculeatus aculeatus TaxID=481459 RepID=UPI001A9807C0|nr:nebulette-like [Gasterosteus aculeatus aculeatus]